MQTTITAIATPLGKGGVGIIRLSGPDSLPILKKIFVTKTQNFEPKKMVYGKISFDGITDNCLAVFFKGPNSFTGEDVVEIQMHGGVKLLESTLKKLLSMGATMAEPGEFSKRAVMNGKMDITEAEALIDMIEAQSVLEMQVASAQMEGKLYKEISEIQNALTDILASIEVALDYPEHEDTFAEEQIKAKVPAIVKNLEKLSQTESVGSQIKNGVNIALVGKPNVGKSSLLNALLGYNRAIVTDIAGTTRDTISGSYEYKGIRFNIIDTAGLHETEDVVEKEGIKRTLQAVENCDFVIFLHENGKIDTENYKKFDFKHQNFANVLNKCDKIKPEDNFDLCISVKENISIDKLKELIYSRTINQELLSSQLIITNARQANLIKQAKEVLTSALDEIDQTSIDCISVYIKQSWEILGQITGETANEKIIDTIFSKFCLGK